MSELLSSAARRSMRKELVRLRMEMHRQQLRHHAQPLTRPLNYLGQLRRDSPGSLEPSLLLTAEVLLSLFGSRLGRFGKLARVALLFYPLVRGAQKSGGVPYHAIETPGRILANVMALRPIQTVKFSITSRNRFVIDGQPLAVFQPFIDTATGRIAGIETLGRLRQADASLRSVGPLFTDPKVSPASLRRLDRQVREDALARLQDAPEDWFLSLNISPRWISRLRPNQPLPSLKQLQKHGVDPRRVVFEITELSGGSQKLGEVVARYREAGARIAIDDFGAGYSQLDRVLALQPDILKLDMRLFQEAARGGPSGEVVKALAQMAEKTGCWIIAEGVETEAELHFALECGARYVQGYLFAQAELEFFASDAFVPRFAYLRDQYVQRKLAERARLMTLRQQLTELMNLVRHWVERNGRLDSLLNPNDYPWLLRIYQCDRHGTQISPNLQWDGQRWGEDARYLGHNWSWRPYFYQLLAEGWEERRLTLSSTYRDATSNQYCLTAGQFIDNGRRLLLLDIDAAGF